MAHRGSAQRVGHLVQALERGSLDVMSSLRFQSDSVMIQV